jgi:hypothetical protein
MLTAPDGRADGQRIDYLANPAASRHRDPSLFDFLRHGLDADQRDVRVFEESPLLPDARYFRDLLNDDASRRSAYFVRALRALAGADLLFFDPDNGLEVPSTPYGRSGSCRYLYWCEVEQAIRTGASVLVFQHWTRENHDQLTRRLAKQLGSSIPHGAVAAIHSSYVLFLAACQPCHRERFAKALELVNERWTDDLHVEWAERPGTE